MSKISIIILGLIAVVSNSFAQHVSNPQMGADSTSIGYNAAMGQLLPKGTVNNAPTQIINMSLNSFIVNGPQVCGPNSGLVSVAACPAGRHLKGGGYRLTYWNTQNYLNAPDASFPLDSFSWVVYPNGQSSCFISYAVCE